MPIELAKIQLHRVHHIATLEQAALVHHRVPGLEGNLTQDLGRDSVRLQIEGIFYGAKAKDNLATLRKAYKQREPVDFLADVVGQAYFSQVVLERFEVVQSAQIPDQFSYRLTIAEYVPPKKSAAQNAAAVNRAVKTQAAALMDIASLTDALSMGSIPELTNPAEPLNAAVGEVETALNAIQDPMTSLKDLFGMQAEVPIQPSSSLPPPASLKWVKQPPPEALLKAGLPLKNLLSSGASVETLLKAGVSVLELRQAGVSAAALTQAGVSSAALTATESALNVLSALETLPQITLEVLDEDGTPLMGQEYHIAKSDHTTLKGRLDDQGQCQIEVVAGQTFTITFPDLDRGDWELLPAAMPPETQPRTASVAFVLVDEEDAPLANQDYQITLPDGAIQTGQCDDQGQVQIAEIPAGICTLSFPDLDAADWQLGLEDSTPAEPSPVPKTAQIAFEVVDEAGIPLANQDYQITLPDRTTQTRQLDAQGHDRIEGIAAGHCTIAFPNLDAGDWQLVEVEGAIDPIPESAWLSFEVVSEEGVPLSGIRYQLWQEETLIRVGVSDAKGRVLITELPTGLYSVTFPELNGEDWQLHSS